MLFVMLEGIQSSPSDRGRHLAAESTETLDDWNSSTSLVRCREMSSRGLPTVPVRQQEIG